MASWVIQLVSYVHLGHTTLKFDYPVTKLCKHVHHRSLNLAMKSSLVMIFVKTWYVNLLHSISLVMYQLLIVYSPC
jgi:hypothetical protein